MQFKSTSLASPSLQHNLLQAKLSVDSLPQGKWVCWLAFVAATASQHTCTFLSTAVDNAGRQVPLLGTGTGK